MTLPPLEMVRLDNGFRALLVPRQSLPVVATVMWYEVGSRDERTGETGVSHFLEHMMFKGTPAFAKGQIDLQTSKMGGNNNAFTDVDGTAYYFHLAADRWDTALEIERSRMRDCLLDPLEFASEKNVVLEELAMGEDDPWRPLLHAAEALLWQVHPYHHPVIGWKQDLERLTVGQMRDYYDRHYGPNRAFLTVAGAIDVPRTTARIHELFGNLPASAIARSDVLTEPAPGGERRAELRTPHSVARLCMAFPTCRVGEADDYALDVLAHELGLSKNSRLYRRLVLADEAVTEVSVINETRRDPGALLLICELRDGVSPKQVERAIREEIDGLIAEGVGKAALQRIRAQIRSSFLLQDEAVLDQALKVARFEALAPGGHATLATVLPTYDALDGKTLRAVAAKYFDFRKAVVVWALPAVAAVAMPKRVKSRPAVKQRRRPAAAKTASKRKPEPARRGGARRSS
ncbi:MAG: insulinase family protein [Planctomycetes bacterium]|nr:insulinase family protein [Planctomycetota bacterium]